MNEGQSAAANHGHSPPLEQNERTKERVLQEIF